MKKILLMVMVAIILSIFISLHENYIAHALEPPLPIRMDKHDYVNTETAHFDMSGPPQSILKLDITRASDNRTFSYTVVTDSDGLAAFSLNLQSYQSDIYSALVSHGISKARTEFTVGLLTSHRMPVQTQNSTNARLPLQQFKSGINMLDIKCSDSLVLMKKASTNSPVCVTPETAKKLVERHWGISINPNTFPYNTLENSTTGTMNVTNTKFSVNYTITNGKILDIKGDIRSKSLIVSIKSDSKGVLTITIPRGLLDPKKPDNQTDDIYFVLNDGQENTDFQETKTTTTDRTLSIPFEDGTEEIELIGTFIT